MAQQPTLTRTLGLRSLVLLGLAYMTPIIVLGIFGVVAGATAGASASAYLVALVAMIFTASSYGRLATHSQSRVRLIPTCAKPSTRALASWLVGRSCSTTCSCQW